MGKRIDMISFDGVVARNFSAIARTHEWIKHVSLFGARYLIFIFALGAMLWVWNRSQEQERFLRLFELGLSGCISWGTTLLISYSIGRLRPYQTFHFEPLFRPLIETPSFPSGHATIAFAIAGTIFFHDRLAGIICMGVALLVGCSRIGIGVHYPTDIFAGAVVGLVVAWGMHV